MGLLEGKVVYSVGGGSGIGRAVIERFVGEGARVGVLDRYAEKLDGLAQSTGAATVGIEGDARSFADHERAVETTLQTFGGIDVVVCFAALHDAQASLASMPGDRIQAAFDELYSVNVVSNLLAVRAALDPLLASRGNIVLTVSHAGFFADGGGVLYTSSKFAVRGLVTQLAHELAPHLRVNGVAPGFALTPLQGLESLDQGAVFDGVELEHVRPVIDRIMPFPYDPVPESHTGSYLFLAADSLSPAVTGVIVNSDGGSAARGFNQVNGGSALVEQPAI